MNFFSKCDQIPQFAEDLVTYSEETLNGKLQFLCSAVIFKKGYVFAQNEIPFLSIMLSLITLCYLFTTYALPLLLLLLLLL